MVRNRLTQPAGRTVQSVRDVSRAFAHFKADPTSLRAGEHLRATMAAVELMPPDVRYGAARHVAKEFIGVVGQAPEDLRDLIVGVMASAATSSPTFESALRDVSCENGGIIHQRFGTIGIGTSDNGGDGSTRSFELHMRDLVARNPRFAGMGQVEVDIRSNRQVRVRKKYELPSGVMPWWHARRRELGIAIAAACICAVTAITTALVLRSPGQNADRDAHSASAPSTTNSAEYSTKKEQDAGNRVTPDEHLVLKAVSKAVVHKGTQLSMSQIFDVYDYIVANIGYLDVSERLVPRWPKETLEAGWGDCKSMSVLLASMLESIGAKTVMIFWYDAEKKQGHEYVGVLISDAEKRPTREMSEKAIRLMISRRYSQQLHKGRKPEAVLRFSDAHLLGVKGRFLLLDPSIGPRGVPGIAFARPDIEHAMESRPGKRGHTPGLE
jgi:hypothetical protein